MDKKKRWTVVVCLLVAVLAGIGVSYPLYRGLSAATSTRAPVERDSAYSDVAGLLRDGQLARLTFRGLKTVVATAADGTNHRAMLQEVMTAGLARDAAAAGVVVEFKPEEFLPREGDLTAEALLAVLGNLAIFGGIGALFFFSVRGPIGGRTKAYRATAADSTVRFHDVAGCDAEKHELMEVVEFLKDPQRFTRLGGKVPTGVLMSGPPGTGKTLVARAVAGEAGVPFFSASGSDFVEMYVGVGAGRVRSMFAQAKKKAPCILFIDEIDAVGRARSQGGQGGAHEEREQTLNQLLVEMDGFKANCGVIVIAATNRPEILDPALVRPGRFSRHIVLPNPDVKGRERILTVHSAKVTLDGGVDLLRVARGTTGFSGAELANLVNEAAILAARSNRAGVTMIDFDHAKDRILMGNERPGLLMRDADRKLTAYHEAGHALVALLSPASDPIHKVTIMPRGRALGMVVRLPEQDSPALRRSRLEADLAVAMGGRAAEELVFGVDDVSTGASGDIQAATHLARRMVTEWGMSGEIGMVAHVMAAQAGDFRVSDHTAQAIDFEVRALVERGHDRALALLVAHFPKLHAIAQALLEQETLSGDEVAVIAAAA